MARRPVVEEDTPPPSRPVAGVAVRAFQVSYGLAFLSYAEGAPVPADAEFQAFAAAHSLPVEWSDAA